MTLPERGSQQWEEMGTRVNDTIHDMTMGALLGKPHPVATVMFHDAPTGEDFIAIVRRSASGEGLRSVTHSHTETIGQVPAGMPAEQVLGHIIDEGSVLICDTPTLERMEGEGVVFFEQARNHLIYADSPDRKLGMVVVDLIPQRTART